MQILFYGSIKLLQQCLVVKVSFMTSQIFKGCEIQRRTCTFLLSEAIKMFAFI